MGQSSSTPAQKYGGSPLEPFRQEQLGHLRTQLNRLNEVLTLVDAAQEDDADLNAAAAPLLSDASLTSAGPLALLQPFAQVLLAGYQLGNDSFTQPLSLPSCPHPCSALSVLARNTALAVLDVSYNNLTPAVVMPLLSAIRDLPTLTVLHLSGNPLGSAGALLKTGAVENVSDDLNGTPYDLSQADTMLSPAAAATAATTITPTTAAEQLGCWLATCPPLEELSLFQCAFKDADVAAVLRGLIPQATAETASSLSSRLAVLRLGGNPACTWRCARMTLQLVTDFKNKTLRVVELEGAAPATEVRLEYACTPEGIFRSGNTLLPRLDQPNSTKHENENARLSTQKEKGEEDAEKLTPAQSARYRGRQQHLRVDLDGTRVMQPGLMRELQTVLAQRQAAHSDSADMHHSTSLSPPPREQKSGEDASEKLKNGEEGPAMKATGDDAEKTVSDAESRPQTQPVDHAQTPSSPPADPPRALTAPQPRHRTPQQRRAARFETPQRIAQVMAEAAAFRRHVHPLQVDTRAPPCADVHTRSTASQYGSERAAATWYVQEGFVLRPNGMSSVLVAPVLPGSVAPRRNVLREDVEDHPLHACWCTPRNTTSAATYAGSLHYHCVREGEPVHHSGGQVSRARQMRSARAKPVTSALQKSGSRGVSAGGGGSRAASARLGGGGVVSVLPPIVSADPFLADKTRATKVHGVATVGRSYQACCGTGHSCLSAAVAGNGGGALRAQRMRATLLSRSSSKQHSVPGARASVRSVKQVRDFASSSSDGSAGETDGSTADGGGLLMTSARFGGAKTVHTTSNGLAVALNYSPVAYFAGPRVPCAVGMEVEECS